MQARFQQLAGQEQQASGYVQQMQVQQMQKEIEAEEEGIFAAAADDEEEELPVDDGTTPTSRCAMTAASAAGVGDANGANRAPSAASKSVGVRRGIHLAGRTRPYCKKNK